MHHKLMSLGNPAAMMSMDGKALIEAQMMEMQRRMGTHPSLYRSLPPHPLSLFFPPHSLHASLSLSLSPSGMLNN